MQVLIQSLFCLHFFLQNYEIQLETITVQKTSAYITDAKKEKKDIGHLAAEQQLEAQPQAN